jgi:RNA polymerase sigma-70 factor (ECF subfamily)
MGLDDLQADGQEPQQPPESDNTDRKALIEWALGQLPTEDAAIMTFFYLEELGIDEIVTITGLGASNVKVKLHRSRKKVLAILQDHLKSEVWTLQAD